VDRAAIALLEALAAALRAGLAPAQALQHVATLGAFGVQAGAGSGSPAGARSSPPRWLARPRSHPPPAEDLAAFAGRLAGQAASGVRLEPVLRAEAERLASPALLALAAGWGMTERYGAPVVDVLDGLVEARRDAARTAAAVETALAAPRATASLLAALPFGGVVLGEVVGINPLATLVGTAFGRVDLAFGLLATWGGRVWMRRLVAAVSRMQ
jgi:tight adherence protein B